MRLYIGSTAEFVEDAARSAIAEKLKAAFFNYFRYYPSNNEISSWENSLSSLGESIRGARLLEHGVILEYQLPLTSRRLDALLTGLDCSLPAPVSAS